MAVDVRYPILVDSSISIDLLRAGQDVGLRFRNRIEGGSISTCAVIRIEVLRGIVDRRVREQMERLFNEMVDRPIDETLASAAAMSPGGSTGAASWCRFPI